MFALLQSDNSHGVPTPAWQQMLIRRDGELQTKQEPSFLDQLAAPTVFLQQALVFKASLDSDAVQRAVADVLHQYPAFGHRLTSSQASSYPDGQLLTVPTSPAGSSGIAFLQAESATLTLQQLLQSCNSPTAGASSVSAADTSASVSASIASISAGNSSSTSSHQQQVPELPDLLFSHLPGSLLPDYLNSDLALVHVALLQLEGGGSVLGVRMSHLLGDWTSLRLLLRNMAAAYTNAAHAKGREQQQQQQQQGRGQAQLALQPLVPAAPLLNSLATAVLKQQQAAGAVYTPLRLKPLEQADKDVFAKLAEVSRSSGSSSSSGSSQRPVRLSYFVPPSRVQRLKQQLLAEAARNSGGSNGSRNCSSESSSAVWCSPHNALLASVLKVFGSLPGRQGLPHDVSVAVDMRGRVPAQQLQLLGQQQQQLQMVQELQRAVGNFFASAIAEGCVAQQCTRAELAQVLHAAVPRASKVWLPDLAWAAGMKGMAVAKDSTAAGTHTAGALQEANSAAAGPEDTEAKAGSRSGNVGGVAVGEVTWRRLHAMGPTALLQHEMGLGLLASLSTTQWPLDFARDAAFAGHLPCLAVPAFSQPQPYPLLLMQQATPAQGGGWMVYVFLDAAEAPAMQRAVSAQGGL